MKAVYSFCSKSQHKSGTGGFYNLFSYATTFALSVNLSKQHFDKVELVTDTEGEKKLAEMGILTMFDSYDLRLDKLNVDSEFWIAGKLLAYIQDEPFLHIDSDVFLFKGLGEYKNNGVLFQSLEPFSSPHFKFYETANKILTDNMTDFCPCEFSVGFGTKYSEQAACCTGIFGGTNITLIR